MTDDSKQETAKKEIILEIPKNLPGDFWCAPTIPILLLRTLPKP